MKVDIFSCELIPTEKGLYNIIFKKILMTEIEWSDFSKKRVTDSKGTHMGHVADVKVDSHGKIQTILVTDSNVSRENAYTEYERIDGRYHIPIENVESVKDQLVVD